jgi:hypothetical protein
MDPNPFTFLNQVIGQLLATNSPAIQTMGLDLFRGLAVIMIAWFGIQKPNPGPTVGSRRAA